MFLMVRCFSLLCETQFFCLR